MVIASSSSAVPPEAHALDEPAPVGPGASALAAQIDLDAEPLSVCAARSLSREMLDRWEIAPATVEDAVLVVSELVTNAVRHGAAPIHLRLAVVGDELVVEVQDAGTSMPRALRPTHEDLHGRGLQLVAAVSCRWGVRRLARGKSVGSALAL